VSERVGSTVLRGRFPLRSGAAMAAVLGGLAVLSGTAFGQRFLALHTLQGMAFQLPELGTLALAMMVTLLAGGINLAVVATANLSALAMAAALHALTGPPWDSALLSWATMPMALLAGAAVGVAIGGLNGFLVAYVRVSPIVATLGTMTFVEGLSLGLTHGGVVSGFPHAVLAIGSGTLFDIPIDLILFAALAGLLALILRRTPFGRYVYLVGSNQAATRFSGVDTARVLLGVYVLSGAICWLGGLIMLARFNSANATYGQSYLLVTILAAVLGGVHPNGGSGTVRGLVLALVVLQLISTALNLLGFNNFLTLAIWGLTLVLVFLVPAVYRAAMARCAVPSPRGARR